MPILLNQHWSCDSRVTRQNLFCHLKKSLRSLFPNTCYGIHRAPTAPPSEASSSPNPGKPVPIGFEARVGTKWSEVETLWSTADCGEGSKRCEFLLPHWANPRPSTTLREGSRRAPPMRFVFWYLLQLAVGTHNPWGHSRGLAWNRVCPM